MQVSPTRPIAWFLLGLIALLPVFSRADDLCPAKTTYDALHKSLVDLRSAIQQRYGERWTTASLPAQVADEYSRLDTLDRDAEISARELTEQWDEITSKLKRLDFERRDLQSKGEQLNRDQTQLNRKINDLAGRIQVHNNNVRQHDMVRPVPTPKNQAAVAAWNSVADDLNRRAKALNDEKTDLGREQQALDDRRATLTKQENGIIEISSALMAQRARMMRSISGFMAMAGGDTARAMALKQLIASRMELSVYSAPNPPSTAQMEREVAESLGKEAVVQIAKRAGLASGWPAMVVTAEEVVYDTANAAVDARTKEVQKNMLLIGDYGRLLKRMKEGGTLKADDPTYQAIRATLKQKQEDMPADGKDVVLEGLATREALMAAATSCLGKAAGNYAGEKVEHLGQTVIKNMTALDRQVVGKTMLKFFEHAISASGEAVASETAEKTVEGGSEWIQRQLGGDEPPAPPRQTFIAPSKIDGEQLEP